MKTISILFLSLFILSGCGGDGKIPPNPKSEKGQQYLRDQAAKREGRQQ